MPIETMEKDKANEAEAMKDELQNARNNNKSATTEDKPNESTGKMIRAEFY